MPPLIFYFPYPNVGGVSVLFLRLAEQLRDTEKVTLVDLPDGFMARNCPDHVNFISINDIERIPHDAIVITQTCPPWRLPFIKVLPGSVRLFFWNLHPDNLSSAIIGGRSMIRWARLLKPLNPIFSISRRQKLRQFLQLALDNRSIAFMDSMNAEKTMFWTGLNFNQALLPICTEESPGVMNYQVKDGIDCAWLGRLEDFKTPVLLHLMERLDVIEDTPIRLSIYGDGRDRSAIVEAAAKLRRVKCHIHGSLQLDELNDELIKHNALFAMGASALEGAKLGIPTFCLDYSYKLITQLLCFRLICEVEGLNLGEEISTRHFEEYSTLEGKLREIMVAPQVVGQRCFDYWQQHHSPIRVARNFLELAKASSLTVGQLRELGFTRPDFLTTIRSSLFNPNPVQGWAYF